MANEFFGKYNTARHIYIPLRKAGSTDHALTADWTPANGDVKISKDGGAAANVTNLPVAILMGNSTIWDFSLTATELSTPQAVITIADTATKAVVDDWFQVTTYGNASAQNAFDLGTAIQDVNVVTIEGGTPSDATELASAVWDALTAALTTVNSVGKLVVDKLTVISTVSSSDVQTAAEAAITAQLGAISSSVWGYVVGTTTTAAQIMRYLWAFTMGRLVGGSTPTPIYFHPDDDATVVITGVNNTEEGTRSKSIGT